jgi:hypothetical protein
MATVRVGAGISTGCVHCPVRLRQEAEASLPEARDATGRGGAAHERLALSNIEPSMEWSGWWTFSTYWHL